MDRTGKKNKTKTCGTWPETLSSDDKSTQQDVQEFQWRAMFSVMLCLSWGCGLDVIVGGNNRGCKIR